MDLLNIAGGLGNDILTVNDSSAGFVFLDGENGSDTYQIFAGATSAKVFTHDSGPLPSDTANIVRLELPVSRVPGLDSTFMVGAKLVTFDETIESTGTAELVFDPIVTATGSAGPDSIVLSGSTLTINGDPIDLSMVTELTIDAGDGDDIIIGGSLVSGSDYSGSNVILNSATIRAVQNVGKLIIKGSVLGTANTQIFITASGQETIFLNTDQDVAFGSIAIGGSVIHSSILAGYGTGTVATESEENPIAQIGTVVVGGDWVASNLLSGARWSDSFGDGLDSKAAGVDSPAITARITSIAIIGQIIGTASSSTDQFRFMAQAIDTMTVGGSLVSLDIRKGNDNDLLAPRYNLANTLDVRVFEFPDV